MNLDFYLQQPFAQHALLAGAMVAVTCGLIGPFVVMRGMAFAVHGTSELAFTGATIDNSVKANGANSLAKTVATQGDTQAFGLALFHGFAFPFEVTSFLIVVAILGAMVLGRKS